MTASASALLSSSVRTGFISRGSFPNSPGNPAIRVPSGCGLELGTIALPAEATMRLRPPRRAESGWDPSAANRNRRRQGS
jgi:hypothetical protein